MISSGLILFTYNAYILDTFLAYVCAYILMYMHYSG